MDPASKDAENGTLLQSVRTQVETSFFGLSGASATPSCIPGLSCPSRQKRYHLAAIDRVRCRLGVAVNRLGARGRPPLCPDPNRHSPFLSQGLCGATTAVP